MRQFLRECRANFGPSPRQLDRDELAYLNFAKPDWLMSFPSDGFHTLFRHRTELYQSGGVVWGHIIQVNRRMLKRGIHDCPGEVVYSYWDASRAEPEDLQRVAYEIGSLKGEMPDDPNLLTISNYLTNETIRVFGLEVPTVLSPEIRCHISTTFFVRKHLPQRMVCSGLLPLIVNRRKPRVVLPLPSQYWPDELIDWWSQ